MFAGWGADVCRSLKLVDDESIHRRLLKSALNGSYDLLEAANGQQAMELAGTHPLPDLVLVDVLMPGTDGHEVCRQLKADPVTCDIPVIFVTVVGDDSNEEVGFQLGAVDYITKPIRPLIARARVRAHLELERHRRHLSRLVEERTRELAAANERAMAAEAAKNRFLACMSHELRTPMTGIIGTACLLSDTQLDADQRKYLDLFKNASEALMKVLADILAFVDLSSGNLGLNLQEANPWQLIEDVSTALKATAVQRGNHLQVEIGESVPVLARLDPVRFRQVNLSLLSNAVKFTEKGKVSLRASMQKAHGGSRLEVVISDTGIGMSAQQVETAFGAFNKLGDAMTGPQGTGLGLANSKHLVELMGGETDMESTPGQGTHVRFSIPLE